MDRLGACLLPHTPYRQAGEKRKVTFCFGGGPGASSAYLHMGGIGPYKIQNDGQVVENFYNSLIPWTDLVFIDPPGTGFSSEDPDSYGYQQDVQIFAEFIQSYLHSHGYSADDSVNILGASYGGARASALASRLKGSVTVDNLFLISPALDYQALYPSEGNDLPYVLSLEVYATCAYRHGKLPASTQALTADRVLREAELFLPRYQAALEEFGTQSDAEELSDSKLAKFYSVARTLHELTGVPENVICEHRLRIPVELFTSIHRLSRLDGRFGYQEGDDRWVWFPS